MVRPINYGSTLNHSCNHALSAYFHTSLLRMPGQEVSK